MYTRVRFAALLILLPAVAGAQCFLSAEHIILLPADASPAELFAAHELGDHLGQIQGLELEIRLESPAGPVASPFLSIGRTCQSLSVLPDQQFQQLARDGYTIVPQGPNLFLLGPRPRGSLYAVYHFLESLGVRWYSPDFTVVPSLPRVELPDRAIVFAPEFSYRDQWWNNGPTPQWLARMRVNGSNGQNHTLPEKMGGSAVTLLSCHSYKDLVPPGEHFQPHPQWFALMPDGSRNAHNLCLTNPELRDFVVRKVTADLDAHPARVDYYWVSQNDGGSAGCFCESCTAQRRAHGDENRWSANTIDFASHVARAIKHKHHETRIKTLAYSYTVQAPENLLASDNLVVEICGNFKADDPAHANRVAAWSKVAANLSVYTYGASNYGYWWPYPNAREVAYQYPLALANGVRLFYIQGAALGKGSGLVDLKAWLSARMAWDPRRDPDREIRQFARGFYGPAAEYILEYLAWYPRYIQQHQFIMEGGWGNDQRWRDWVTRDAMIHCDQLFQQALAAVHNHHDYLRHVRRAYLEVLWGSIMIEFQPGHGPAAIQAPAPADPPEDPLAGLLPTADRDDITRRLRLFTEIMAENQYDKLSEITPFKAPQ